jgi:hypothetical protein
MYEALRLGVGKCWAGDALQLHETSKKNLLLKAIVLYSCQYDRAEVVQLHSHSRYILQ